MLRFFFWRVYFTSGREHVYLWPIRRFGNISNERTIPLIILFDLRQNFNIILNTEISITLH
jgi:hypothetical protein